VSTETERIASQLNQSIEGPAWHGPSLKEVLEGVNAGMAAAKPLAGAHSIWDLVNHVLAWQAVALATLHGSEYHSLAGEADWPRVSDRTESAWQSTLTRVDERKALLGQAIRGFPDDRLDELVPGRQFRFYDLVHGVVQHNLYHAGQIAILKRALLTSSGCPD
jgi:uncharacterized damage-inducible protein DinB